MSVIKLRTRKIIILIDAFIGYLIDNLSVVSYRKQIDMRGDFPCMCFFFFFFTLRKKHTVCFHNTNIVGSRELLYIWRHNLKSRALYLTETLLEPYTVYNMSLCWYFHPHFVKV